MDIKITSFDSHLLDQLNQLPPHEWNCNAYELFLHNEWQPWFFPYQAVIENRLAAFGMFILFEENAWLGWILVHPHYRNRGLGKTITKHLIEEAKKKGALNFILTASEMGFPVYDKLGFVTTSHYKFFHCPERFISEYEKKNIRNAKTSDLNVISKLDFKATGEKRISFLESHLEDVWVYDDNGLNGFYISNFGNGLIIAEDYNTGLQLINFRCKKNKQTIVLPEKNFEAIEFLINKGFKETMIVPRMVLGTEPSWNPQMIFSRGTGYCG